MPLVRSIKDIMNKKHLAIYKTQDGNQWAKALQDSYKFKPAQIQELVDRIQKNFKNFTDENIGDFFTDLIQGKFVILTSTSAIKTFLRTFKEIRHQLKVSKRKYLPDFGNLFIRKDHFLSKRIIYL